jgi:hypothetical protein
MQYTKIVILITAFIFSFNLNQIKAQSEYTSKNVIKANVLGAAIGGFSISYKVLTLEISVMFPLITVLILH